jgi:hypothetical protein
MKSAWVVMSLRQVLTSSLTTNQHVNSLANCAVFASKEEAEKHAANIKASSRAWTVAVKELPVYIKAEGAPLPKAGAPEN